ncbi:unnamed protein product [Rotaria socialis]
MKYFVYLRGLQGNQGDKWLNGQVTVKSSSYYRIRIERVVGNSFQGDAAIDDLRIFENPCVLTPPDADPSNIVPTTTSTKPTITNPPGPYDCTFESGLCNGWENMANNRFNWTRVQASTVAAPEIDHTTNTVQGYFMQADLSKGQANDYARLKSPTLNNPQCMTFYYHLLGQGGTLNLYMAAGDNLGISLWKRKGTQGDLWRFGRMEIKKTNVNIVFEAIAGPNSIVDVSIDDVIFTSGACKESAAIGESCTFTDFAQCGFTQNATASSLQWKTYTGSDTQVRTTPIPFDHTTGTNRGSYAYIDLESQGENLNGRLYSPMYKSTKTQSYCLEFYYVLAGSNNTFNILTETTGSTPRALFTRNYDHGFIWNKGEITLPPLNNVRIVFEIITGYLRQGFVALDDSMVKEGECSLSANECTFDDNTYCSWTNAADNQFDWILRNGTTPSADTGPNGDHKIYFDNRPRCFSFWYNMYGVDVGRLIVYVRSLVSANLTSESLVWALAGPRVRGKSFEGDIAVDEIGVQQTDSCKLQPFEADPVEVSQALVTCRFEDDFCQWKFDPTGQFNWTRHTGSTGSSGTGPTTGADNSPFYIYIEASYPRERNETQSKQWRVGLINLRDIPYNFALKLDGYVGSGWEGDISLDEIFLTDGECPPTDWCDFETSFCGWINDTTGDFYWTRTQKATDSIGTEPTTDHTTGTDRGYYIYIETSSPQIRGQKARLISPMYTQASSVCLKFHYHMFGPSIGSLNVLIAGTQRLLWTKSGNLGNRWRYGHVTVRNDDQYQIAFEGVVGSSFQGDIAVDDISLANGPCEEEGSCNFEDGTFCGFYNPKDEDNFDWALNQGGTISFDTGPTVDHTTGTSVGYYAYIESSFPQNHGDKAWLVSEILESPKGACLDFWYHMKGNTTGNMSVYHRVLDAKPTSLWFKEA